MKKIIECRRTGQGALTRVLNGTPGVSIREFDHSKTGNHWKVEINFETDKDCCLIQDISNSGKHNCYMLWGDGTIREACKPNQSPECE